MACAVALSTISKTNRYPNVTQFIQTFRPSIAYIGLTLAGGWIAQAVFGGGARRECLKSLLALDSPLGGIMREKASELKDPLLDETPINLKESVSFPPTGSTAENEEFSHSEDWESRASQTRHVRKMDERERRDRVTPRYEEFDEQEGRFSSSDGFRGSEGYGREEERFEFDGRDTHTSDGFGRRRRRRSDGTSRRDDNDGMEFPDEEFSGRSGFGGRRREEERVSRDGSRRRESNDRFSSRGGFHDDFEGSSVSRGFDDRKQRDRFS